MSTSQRSGNYYGAVVRKRMLDAVVSCLDAALNTAADESGVMFRLREMLQRAEDEAEQAQKAVDRAEVDL
jgi:hypothetical protein